MIWGRVLTRLLLCSWVLTLCLSCALSAGHSVTLPERARGGSVYRQMRAASQPPSGRRRGTLHVHDRPRDHPQNYTVNNFTQWLDHDDETKGTFRQRYWVDTGMWRGAPRVLLYIYGEGPAHSSPTGYAQEYGYSSGSLIFALEHRFYGESLPGPLTNRSLLAYVSVEQVLADLKHFKDAMTARYFPDAAEPVQWYVVGGSYAGAVAAWVRETYPDDFVAAWSSSGVVNAIFDFYEFDYHLVKVLAVSCAAVLRDVFRDFSEHYARDPAAVRRALDVPDHFAREDIAWMLVDGAAMAVQYGQKEAFCAALEGPDGGRPTLTQYRQLLQRLWGGGFTRSCYYSTACLSDPRYHEEWGASYVWVYQCCSQLAYWQVGYPNSLRLPEVNSTYFMDQCRRAYGDAVFPNTYQFNRKFGGAYPRTDHVIALQGSDDPWRPAGAAASLGPDYPVVVAQCSGCGHCGDLHAPRAGDPDTLVRQRALIRAHLDKWLGVDGGTGAV
ncbi:serine carboxypeptidase S28 [Strigomonas culicis]|uniref:Serine carboxypeptidase S28 n=1 Tax=Strigomonas culicis TaxID=28005 RepID=S9WDM6_9TRYP|nr:serine carboxypeptidase S28 [Strigomonas culicis]|eukprot:EPY37236.1 serine carboxypeptidase S28 [Strigomonas culicis]